MSVTLEKEATVSAIQELFEKDDRVVLVDIIFFK
jgi:aspartate-semialdehyde dehydrogenase